MIWNPDHLRTVFQSIYENEGKVILFSVHITNNIVIHTVPEKFSRAFHIFFHLSVLFSCQAS